MPYSRFIAAAITAAALVSCKNTDSATSSSKSDDSINPASLTDVNVAAKNWVSMNGWQRRKQAQSLVAVEIQSDAIAGPNALTPLPENNVQGIPNTLAGIWWTDGDPLPIKALTLNNATWKDDTKLTLVLPVFDAQNYTYIGGSTGKSFWDVMKGVFLIYEITFTDKSYKIASIVPVLDLGVLGYKHVPSWIADFKLVWQDTDGLWNRKSSFFGKQVPDYRFTRIYKGDGSRDDGNSQAFSRYLKDGMATAWVIRDGQ